MSDAPGGGGALPCLNRNNSIEQVPEKDGSALRELAFNRLTSAHRKVAFALKFNVEQLAAIYGIERLGFLTLTFAENITDPKEASRRFNSLNTNVLKVRYADTVAVIERQKSGRLHFHCLVILPTDIRTGVNFLVLEELCRRKTRVKHVEWLAAGVGKNLFAEWAFWRKTAPDYGFGRTELLPVRSNAEAIACYVGKYIAKHIDSREERDKGVRLVRYSRGAARATARFAWNTPGSDNFRRKLAWLCRGLGCTERNYRGFFRMHFGEKWFWRIVGPLFQVRFNWYPSMEHFMNDWPEWQEPGDRPIFLRVNVDHAGDESTPGTVEIVKGSDADARQRACVEILTEHVLEQKRRFNQDLARHLPKFKEFVRTAVSWLEQACPEEHERQGPFYENNYLTTVNSVVGYP